MENLSHKGEFVLNIENTFKNPGTNTTHYARSEETKIQICKGINRQSNKCKAVK